MQAGSLGNLSSTASSCLKLASALLVRRYTILWHVQDIFIGLIVWDLTALSAKWGYVSCRRFKKKFHN